MASPKLEKMQRISPLVPVNDEFYLRRKDRFDKSARKNIYRNCLLPVLSLLANGLIEVPCYLFKMFWRMLLYREGRQPNTRRERFHRRRPPLILRGPNADGSKPGAGTCVIEHLVDGLADPMRLAVASRVGGDASHI
jgi:hypothetical protein